VTRIPAGIVPDVPAEVQARRHRQGAQHGGQARRHDPAPAAWDGPAATPGRSGRETFPAGQEGRPGGGQVPPGYAERVRGAGQLA